MALELNYDWSTAERGLLAATAGDGDTVTLTRDDVEALIARVEEYGQTWYNDGESDGRDYGYDDGYNDGEQYASERYDDGYSEGYAEGLAEGRAESE
jgi:hypothetical protein